MRTPVSIFSLFVLFILPLGSIQAQEAVVFDDAGLISLRESAKAGDTEAKYQLATIYDLGRGSVAKNIKEAAYWYSSAAAAGHTLAQRRIATMHLSGAGVPQSFEEAQRWFFQASQKNDEESQFQLGLLLLSGRGGQMSVENAKDWFERAGEAGHPGAQLELGRLYLEGKHVAANPQRGLKWIRAAAEQSYPPGMHLLASLYERGHLVEENPLQAKAYYTRAADQGHAESQVWLAGWYERQDPPQYPKALRYYKQAANSGNADGYYGVARLHLERLLHASNSIEGLRNLRKAVSLNHAEAHYRIGLMYGNGSLAGGSVRALEHLQHAATLQYPPAMYELALAYYQGAPPLKANPRVAVSWWKQAASLGHVDSQFAFAIAHMNGAGVEKNLGLAFALANVAAAQGHADAARVRDELHGTLPPDVLRKAQDLSVDLFNRYVADASAVPDMRALLK